MKPDRPGSQWLQPHVLLPETDWRLVRQLHSLAIERFCQHVLAEIAGLSSDPGKNNHERYLAVFQLI